jgi:hypothetical protein
MEDRWINSEDYGTLELSLKTDQYHQETKPDFYFAPGSFCKVYEDEQGPILFLRGTKAIRFDIQFLDNRDFKRNRKALIEGFPAVVAQCKAAGFTEIVFSTNSPLLKRFCKQRLNFTDVEGEDLRYFIT